MAVPGGVGALFNPDDPNDRVIVTIGMVLVTLRVRQSTGLGAGKKDVRFQRHQLTRKLRQARLEDPVVSGFASSIARPGQNITGTCLIAECLRCAAPQNPAKQRLFLNVRWERLLGSLSGKKFCDINERLNPF
jgi:hypothetical protein